MSGSSTHRGAPAIIASSEAHTPTDDSHAAFSPAASDVGSLASHANTSMRYAGGSLSAAGMSSLNLAFPGQASSSAQGMAGFNAISAVLNNPHRPSRPIDPSSSRYPAVSASHTELPKVKRSDFDAYLASVKLEWERLERNRRMGQSGRARLDAEDKANALAAAAAAEDGNAAAAVGRVSIEEARSMATGKRRLPPLSAVPQIFFSEDFDMGNPYTFDLVTERYKSVEGADAATAAATNEGGVYDVALNQMLQEKLSYYSDVVEQHLILEISARSSSFFAALGNLQDLEAEAASCLVRVEALQQELQRRDEREAKAGLRIIREQAQRRELSERQAAVQAVRELVERRDLARLLVQSGQWDEALDVVGSLRDMLDGTTSAAATSALPAHLKLEFSAIPSIAAMQPQLRELSDTVAVQLEGELQGVLAADLSERIGSPAEQQPETDDAAAIEVRAETRAEAVHGRAARSNGASASSTPAAQQLTPADVQLVARITPLLAGLVRTGAVEAFVDAYRKTALRGVRQALRAFLAYDASSSDEAELEHLAALIEDDELASGKSDAKAVPGGAAAASRLRDVTHTRFLTLLGGLLDGFTRASRAIEAHTRVIVKVLEDVASREEGAKEGQDESVSMPEGVTPALPLTLASILQDATSLSHVLASRLLSLRAAAHVKLALREFLDLFALAWGYVLRSEVLAGRMIVGLRGAILNQAKSWLAAFHRARIEDAAKKVEEEMWGQAEVTAADQREVKLIVESATGDPVELVLLTDNGSAAGNADKEDAAAEEAQNTKTLEIEDRQYYVVGASLHVLRLLGEYLRVVINLPLLTTEAMGRVVEFLKQFNSRTCQVVLGAGAMRSAGLKNITAKHLALASQSLSIVITLIPYVRETVRRHLSATQAVMLIEFDKLRRDYQEHQYEIHAKLVAIMSDRLTVHCRALSNLDFNAPLPGSPPEASKPIADLVKETATLHKVLYKYLHETSVENVMSQVLTSIDKRLAAEIAQTEVRGSEARERLAEDKALLDKKLGTLKSVEWKPTELEAVLADKQKTAAAAPPPPASPAPSEPTTPAPYKARIPFLARRAGTSATHSPGGGASTNGRTSFDSAPGTPPLASRPSFDSRRSLERPSSERENVAASASASAAASAAAPLSEEPEAEAEKNDAPPQLPTKDEAPPSEAPSTATDPTPAEVAASTSSAPSVATSEGPAISTLQIDPQNVQLPASAPPTPRSDSPAPPTPTSATAESTPAVGGAAPAPPSKPARMTLQQRLAEAAKKRAAAANAGAGAGATKPEEKVDVEKAKSEEKKVEDTSEGKKSVEAEAETSGAAPVAQAQGEAQTAAEQDAPAPLAEVAIEAPSLSNESAATVEVSAASEVEEGPAEPISTSVEAEAAPAAAASTSDEATPVGAEVEAEADQAAASSDVVAGDTATKVGEPEEAASSATETSKDEATLEAKGLDVEQSEAASAAVAQEPEDTA